MAEKGVKSEGGGEAAGNGFCLPKHETNKSGNHFFNSRILRILYKIVFEGLFLNLLILDYRDFERNVD